MALEKVEELGDGRILGVAGEELSADEVIRGERVEIAGWTIAYDGTLSVSLYTELDPELELRGRVYELIHTVNNMRKDARAHRPDCAHAARRRRTATP